MPGILAINSRVCRCTMAGVGIDAAIVKIIPDASTNNSVITDFDQFGKYGKAGNCTAESCFFIY